MFGLWMMNVTTPQTLNESPSLISIIGKSELAGTNHRLPFLC
jgi:hypothetical protein